MAIPPVAGTLRTLLVAWEDREHADAELLHRFHAHRDQTAFAELVRRHGPMVLGVCRRQLGRSPDVDDAFQAVFVILAKKAVSVRRPELLGPWLYGVACRVVQRAKRTATRRRAREVLMANVPEQADPTTATPPELAEILDAELAALSEWYRLPILLCDLQGLTRSEAAARLGIPEGTLSSRLANGRKKLAARLANRGITLAALTAFLTDQSRAEVPASLFTLTLESALRAITGGVLAKSVSRLVSEGVATMRTILLLTAAVAMATVGFALTASEEPKPKAEVKKEEVKKEAPEAKARFAKPRMMDYYDVAGAPNAMYWGGDAKEPYLFVQTTYPNPTEPGAYSTKIHVYRPGDEQPVTWFQPPKEHLFIGVFPDRPIVMTCRIDTGGINTLRELRYHESSCPFKGMKENVGVVPFQNGFTNKTNSFVRAKNWLKKDGPDRDVAPLTLDVATEGSFKLTTDRNGVWSSYRVPAEGEKGPRFGLRLLDPITGEVKKQVASVAYESADVIYDREASRAILFPHWSSSPQVTWGITAWNLSDGTTTWNAVPPKEMVSTSVALSDDGNVAAIGYQMRHDSREVVYRIRQIEERKEQVPEELARLKKQAESFPDPVIHILEAASGKIVKKIPRPKGDLEQQIQLSPDGSILLLSCRRIVNAKWVQFVQLLDTKSGGRIHEWEGEGMFAFTEIQGHLRLAIADTVPGTTPDSKDRFSGRVAIWKIEPSGE